MKIELKLFATLFRYMPERPQDGSALLMEVRDGTTIRDLLEQIRVPLDAVKVVFLNGVHAKGDEILKEGDRVGVFPPIAGG